jgi:hypothetical protein
MRERRLKYGNRTSGDFWGTPEARKLGVHGLGAPKSGLPDGLDVEKRYHRLAIRADLSNAYGFSLENLLKGILIAERHEVMGKTRKLNHGLVQYADKVKGITITCEEKILLSALEPYVKWAGRYPMPKTPDDLVTLGHSKSLRDAELALGQKLYDYLRSLTHEIDPVQFMLPSIEQWRGTLPKQWSSDNDFRYISPAEVHDGGGTVSIAAIIAFAVTTEFASDRVA